MSSCLTARHAQDNGGAVHVRDGGSAIITGATLSSNSADEVRVPEHGRHCVISLCLTACRAQCGGAIAASNGGSVTVTDTTLSSNTASSNSYNSLVRALREI